ncbi:glycosyltransferase [Ancylobacter sp. TS-1]|uniref:glycosyltransferase n=1 Tax=Ancylobacter sp. TS-1 TaxID=1850374 RepID=UPI001265B7D0|nr:glycosyltransferase [Ancylobacter sp. TS-1]QFR31897.1 glycosyltransferase [Ancylobacter sp. TS-1]
MVAAFLRRARIRAQRSTDSPASLIYQQDREINLGYPVRVLILDFDFYNTIGGGQVFYRRIIERNPGSEFFYPSRGPDLISKRAGRLPANAHPFAFQDIEGGWHAWPGDHEGHWTTVHYRRLIAGVAVAIQGARFDVVDIPSFLPAAHLIRPVFSAFGISTGAIALSLLGWMSVSSRNAYDFERDLETISAIEAAERRSMNAADIRYTISDIGLHQTWPTELPILPLDMHDTIETFPPPDAMPPGEGPPDIWYVGRLDRAKGPDLFIELMAQVPRAQYGRCLLTGPDNEWSPQQLWSEHVLAQARTLGVEAEYVGRLSDEALRADVFSGRSVVVIPSRTDTFNYVALEATLSGCPVLLSERTGASVFLQERHPGICPPMMNPDDTGDAADKLADILAHYPDRARALRKSLRDTPFPAPRPGFMADVYGASHESAEEERAESAAAAEAIAAKLPLLAPLGEAWRPARPAGAPRVSLVVVSHDRPHALTATLASLMRQSYADIDIVVVADGSPLADGVRDVVRAFGRAVRPVRGAGHGAAAAIERGIAETCGELIGILSDGDLWHPDLVAEAVAALDAAPGAIGTCVDWESADGAGAPIGTHRPSASVQLFPTSPSGLPGAGILMRRHALRAKPPSDAAARGILEAEDGLAAITAGELLHIPLTRAYRRGARLAPSVPA